MPRLQCLRHSGKLRRNFYVLDVYRVRLNYPDLVKQVIVQSQKLDPHRILIGDKGSGTQLIQQLKAEGHNKVKGYAPPPQIDKIMRLRAQTPKFEGGKVFLPREAPWLAEYIRELTTFPGSKHDDQVDATTQALDELSSDNGFGVWMRITERTKIEREQANGQVVNQPRLSHPMS